MCKQNEYKHHPEITVKNSASNCSCAVVFLKHYSPRGLANRSEGLANRSEGLAYRSEGPANRSEGLANRSEGLANRSEGLANRRVK
jgi:hypothetical protein